MRFDELLGEFAPSLDAGALSGRQAVELLHELAARSFFEPASDDVAVTVTASLDDPIVRYDGIWVAGLSAEVWPPAAQPDALLPLSLQRQARMPARTRAPSRAAHYACSGSGTRRAGSACLSWPRSDDDLPLPDRVRCCRRPPMSARVQAAERRMCRAAPGLPLDAWLAAQAPRARSAGAIAPDRLAPGAGAARRRAPARAAVACPFRGFAELRLGVRPLPHPPRVSTRGCADRWCIEALELFWGALRIRARCSATLRMRCSTRSANAPPRRSCRRSALGASGSTRCCSSASAQRTERVAAAQLIEWESTPRALQHPVAGGDAAVGCRRHQSALRLDRVDRLEDGRLVVIDYKSGQHAPFDADAERLTQPQLPAYALQRWR